MPHTDFVKLKIASPEEIRSWSYGEVTKPDTINYRSSKPERDGLFCERIFGPVRDWECHCGKFKRIRFRGHVCDLCGVEVTMSKVRRERMAHIELVVPVAHPWFYKAASSPMASLLGMKRRDLNRVIQYLSYVVTHPGRQSVRYQQLLDEHDAYELRQTANKTGDRDFSVGTGAGAVRTLLTRLDDPSREIQERNTDGLGLDRLAGRIAREIAYETSQVRRKEKLGRLSAVEAIRASGATPELRNRPEWMVMDVIPVLPPDLRPLVPLDGGAYATSDLNELYRGVIEHNNRLKKLTEMRAPETILRSQRRMLQQAVDALLYKGGRSKSFRRRRSSLKSLSTTLSGRDGRFRRAPRGRPVDFSGRAVLVVDPTLRLHECGLPRVMARELFKPFIIHELERRGDAETVRRAKSIADRNDPVVDRILEDIVRDHPVLLICGKAKHRLRVQAFEPVLVDGKAIHVHPLVCTGNADLDGGEVTVHLPLSFEAQLEARVLLLSSNNILLPSNGRPAASPTQDMVTGLYYLTKPPVGIGELDEHVATAGAGDRWDVTEARLTQLYASAPRYARVADAERAVAVGRGNFNDPCWFWTTCTIDDAAVKNHHRGQWVRTTVGRVIFNSVVPPELGYWNRAIGKDELDQIVNRSTRDTGIGRTAVLLDDLKDLSFQCSTQGGFTTGIVEIRPTDQFGDTEDGAPLDAPKRLAPIEYFRSVQATRARLSRATLETPLVDELTRRLVDAVEDVTITEDDCGTVLGVDYGPSQATGETVEPSAGIVGAVALYDIIDPVDDELIVRAGDLIDERALDALADIGIGRVDVRSPLTCEAREGLCRRCYGRDLSSNGMAHIGEAVGIIAAQAIGEAARHAVLHMGLGATERLRSLKQVFELFEARRPANAAVLSELDGTVRLEGTRRGNWQVLVCLDSGDEFLHEVPLSSTLRVRDGNKVRAGDALSLGPVDPHALLKLRGRYAAQDFLLTQAHQEFAALDGMVHQKHIAVIVREMLAMVRVAHTGGSALPEGSLLDRRELRAINASLEDSNRESAIAEPVLSGVSDLARRGGSFIRNAALGHPVRVLTDAALGGARDDLRGMKESLLVGNLIPGGTGIYRDMNVEFLLDDQRADSLESLADEIFGKTGNEEHAPVIDAD